MDEGWRMLRPISPPSLPDSPPSLLNCAGNSTICTCVCAQVGYLRRAAPQTQPLATIVLLHPRRPACLQLLNERQGPVQWVQVRMRSTLACLHGHGHVCRVAELWRACPFVFPCFSLQTGSFFEVNCASPW
jgi:hypothetical protein